MAIRLTPAQLRAMQKRAGYSPEQMEPARKPRPKLIRRDIPEVPGIVHLFGACNPPTTTHQDKIIAKRGTRPVLVDSKKLVNARKLLFAVIPENNTGKRLIGPIGAVIQFRFMGKEGQAVEHHTVKPDLDNLCKTVLDVVAAKNWIRYDEMVSHKSLSKIWVPPSEDVGIYIRLYTDQRAPEIIPRWPRVEGTLTEFRKEDDADE